MPRNFIQSFGVPPQSLPDVAAHLTVGLEFLLPILLTLGLATRLSALALLGWWGVHAYWAALLSAIIAKGPGALSLDRLIFWRDLKLLTESAIGAKPTFCNG